MRTALLCCLSLPAFFLPASNRALGQTTNNVRSGTTATPAPNAPPADADYSAEAVVIQRLDTVYTMAADGTGSRKVTMAARVSSEAAVRQLGIVTIGFAGSSERVEVDYVRVRRADGTVIQTPATGAMEMPAPITQQAPFYSDLKQMQIPVRSLGVGDTLEWQIRVIRTRAEAPGQFWGQESFLDDGVVLSQTLELRVPKDTPITVWSPTNKPAELLDGAEHVYRWTGSQTKPTAGKVADAERELKKKQVWTPEQELDAKEGKLPTVAWTTFRSWDAVGAWYRGLESDRIVPDAAVKAKVAELTAGKTTDEQKVDAVYHFVATQIRYIGVAFGIGRYQPHHAAEVLENQYGDCKDKHTLLAAMLSTLGLHPDAVLIGAGIRFNETLPSPASFNHLITTVTVAGKPVWLDSTEEVAPYQALAYVIRDKSALVIPETGTAKIERTPVNLPFSSFQTMDALGTLDKDGTSNSRLVLTFRGDVEMLMRAALRQISPAQYDAFAQQLSQGIGYSGKTSNSEIGRPEDTAVPLKMSYDYKREKSGDWANHKIVPQLAPVTLPRPDDKDLPVQAIALGVPHVETSTSAMKLPDGWGVELPEAVHAKSAYATYDETYRFEKGTLYAERRIAVLQDKVPVADWKSYKKWADAADLGNEQYVQLITNEQKSATDTKGSGSQAASGVSDNEAAAKLVSSAYSAIQNHSLDTAQSMLDQAKALNPEQYFLWTEYGYLEFSRGEVASALADYRKELSIHPMAFDTYSALAGTLAALDRRKEAEDTLSEWAAVQTSNSIPCWQLAVMLMQDKDGAKAVAAMDAAIARLPEDKKKDEHMQLLLGRAQIMAGTTAKGRATLIALLQSTRDPDVMNNSAYELADAGQELPLAESSTRTAIGRMTEESMTWTADEDPDLLRRKSAMLMATWDTLGWILYREGNLDEAESYLTAAWLNSQSPVTGEHLAAWKAASGDRNGALAQYELALATVPATGAMGVRKAPGPDQKRLQEQVDHLRSAGAKSTISDAPKRLQQLRMFQLGAWNRPNAVTEYRLLLAGDKVERADVTSAKREPEGSQEMVTKARLKGFLPTGSKAHLVRNGMLNCHSGACELVLLQ